jgi:hypothetical protein
MGSPEKGSCGSLFVFKAGSMIIGGEVPAMIFMPPAKALTL